MGITITVDVPVGATPESVLKVKLRAARNVAGITQAELGKRIGEYLKMPALDGNRVFHWEATGNIPAVYLGAIAESLGVEFEFFKI
jgi:transcriptional regulator with XRE-family HTH domain